MNGARVSTGYGCLHTLGMWDEATTRVCVYKKWYLAQPPLASPNLKKNLKISKKILKSPSILIMFSAQFTAADPHKRGSFSSLTRRRREAFPTKNPLSLASPNLKKNLKSSKKSLTNLIVISDRLKQAKISYANGRVSVRIFYKNNLINPNPFLSQE